MRDGNAEQEAKKVLKWLKEHDEKILGELSPTDRRAVEKGFPLPNPGPGDDDDGQETFNHLKD